MLFYHAFGAAPQKGAVAAGKKGAAAGGGAAAAGKAKAQNADVWSEPEMAEDAALTRAEQLFTKEAIEKLENTAWKERVAGVEAMTEAVRQMPGVKAPDEFLDDDSLIPTQVYQVYSINYSNAYRTCAFK